MQGIQSLTLRPEHVSNLHALVTHCSKAIVVAQVATSINGQNKSSDFCTVRH